MYVVIVLGCVVLYLRQRAHPHDDKAIPCSESASQKEAEVIINKAKTKAESESAKITQDGETKLQELQAQIDTGLDDAVKHVVSTVLKA